MNSESDAPIQTPPEGVERHQRLVDLFRMAVDLEPAQRGTLLDAACADHPELRREVELLLAEDSSGTDLPHPPGITVNRIVEDRGEGSPEDQSQFFAIAAQLKRRILVDQARTAPASDYADDPGVVSLDNAFAVAVEHPAKLLEIDRALERLSQLDPGRARVAEMRFFGGLSVDQIAGIAGLPPQTVERQWRAARAWLSRELSSPPEK